MTAIHSKQPFFIARRLHNSVYCALSKRPNQQPGRGAQTHSVDDDCIKKHPKSFECLEI